MDRSIDGSLKSVPSSVETRLLTSTSEHLAWKYFTALRHDILILFLNLRAIRAVKFALFCEFHSTFDNDDMKSSKRQVTFLSLIFLLKFLFNS